MELDSALKLKTDTIIETLKIIKPLLLPVLFILMLYSLIGLNLFKGAFENRCRLYIEESDQWITD